MKFKIGQYIRTKDGFIAKIIQYDEDIDYLFCDSVIYKDYDKYLDNTISSNIKIIDISRDIFDLLKVGDYVNGFRIVRSGDLINNIMQKEKSFILSNGTVINKSYKIKTIVTKRRFDNIKYYLR